MKLNQVFMGRRLPPPPTPTTKKATTVMVQAATAKPLMAPKAPKPSNAAPPRMPTARKVEKVMSRPACLVKRWRPFSEPTNAAYMA